MLALHAAVRFGDHSSLGRLFEIATDVGGRLAAVIAAHAAALRDRDAAAIFVAAHQFEQLGALLSAADAAAQAFQASDGRRTVEGHLYRACIKHSRYRDGISEFGQRGGERCCCSSERQLSARRCHFCTSAAAMVVAFGFRKIRNDPPVGVANRSSTHDSLV
jgi:hypothetical protein